MKEGGEAGGRLERPRTWKVARVARAERADRAEGPAGRSSGPLGCGRGEPTGLSTQDEEELQHQGLPGCTGSSEAP